MPMFLRIVADYISFAASSPLSVLLGFAHSGRLVNTRLWRCDFDHPNHAVVCYLPLSLNAAQSDTVDVNDTLGGRIPSARRASWAANSYVAGRPRLSADVDDAPRLAYYHHRDGADALDDDTLTSANHRQPQPLCPFGTRGSTLRSPRVDRLGQIPRRDATIELDGKHDDRNLDRAWRDMVASVIMRVDVAFLSRQRIFAVGVIDGRQTIPSRGMTARDVRVGGGNALGASRNILSPLTNFQCPQAAGGMCALPRMNLANSLSDCLVHGGASARPAHTRYTPLFAYRPRRLFLSPKPPEACAGPLDERRKPQINIPPPDRGEVRGREGEGEGLVLGSAGPWSLLCDPPNRRRLARAPSNEGSDLGNFMLGGGEPLRNRYPVAIPPSGRGAEMERGEGMVVGLDDSFDLE
ncbi:hypothetical protein EV714DRAFT_240450, partial [Schizophyllum commune]